MTASINPWPPTEVWESRAKARTAFVRKHLPKHGIGAELGVYCGDFTRILLNIAKPAKLHLIDPWHLLGEDWIRFGVWGPTTAEALATVRDRFAPEMVTGQIALHVGDDRLVLPIFDDAYFDWAYIDTIHNYDHITSELQILKDKVKPGGVIAGDDYVSDPKHPSYGVCQAVHDFAARENYDILYASDEDAQFAITRR